MPKPKQPELFPEPKRNGKGPTPEPIVILEPEKEKHHKVQLLVTYEVYGKQENVLKSASKVRSDLRTSMHNPDLDVQIAGIDRKSKIKTLPLDIPKHRT